MRDSPGMRGVKEDAACEAYLVHVANFPEVFVGGGGPGPGVSAYSSTNCCHVVAGSHTSGALKKIPLIVGVSKTTFLF